MKLLAQLEPNFGGLVLRWSSFRIYPMTPPPTKMAATAELSLTLDPMGNSLKILLVWKYLLNCNKTLLKLSLNGLLSELYPLTPPAKQDGHHGRTKFNIGPYGKFIKTSSRLELLVQFEPNHAEMVLRWSSF